MDKWIKLIEENRDEILEKMEEALKQAFEAKSGVFEVILDEDGKVDIANYVSENTTDGDVWTGKAISIRRFNAEDYYKGMSLEDTDLEDLKRILKDIPNGLEAIEKYQKEHEEFDINEFLDSLDPEIKEQLINIVFENEVDWYSAEFDVDLDLYIEQLEEIENSKFLIQFKEWSKGV